MFQHVCNKLSLPSVNNSHSLKANDVVVIHSPSFLTKKKYVSSLALLLPVERRGLLIKLEITWWDWEIAKNWNNLSFSSFTPPNIPFINLNHVLFSASDEERFWPERALMTQKDGSSEIESGEIGCCWILSTKLSDNSSFFFYISRTSAYRKKMFYPQMIRNRIYG